MTFIAITFTATVVNVDSFYEVPIPTAIMSLGLPIIIIVNPVRPSLSKAFQSTALFCSGKKIFFGMSTIFAKAEKLYRGTGNWKG